ncbi:GNAT family N-acetyltransferase [Microtetraspora fusca]|uniref:GNAT family N-acetyltransferase n=1 Tax=Microtetraspora fusca TaxID=1997 RepID=UPI0008314014|nr:GNAT family N-acetyltransferase [Microtetraspora fusca]
MVLELTRAGATDPLVMELCAAQQAELASREQDRDIVHDVPKRLDPRIAFVVAWRDGAAVGCAGLQPLEPGVGEVKRMYVRPAHRGRGVSRALLAEIERLAREDGLNALRLETGRIFTEAVGLYTSSGYASIPRFGAYADLPESVCFEKTL